MRVKVKSSAIGKVLMMAGVLILLAGCGLLNKTHKKASSSDTNIKSKDSSSYVEQLDTQKTTVPGDQSAVGGKIETDSNGRVKPADFNGKGEHSSVNVHVDEKGNLTAKCNCDSYQATIFALKKTITKYKERDTAHSDIKYVPSPPEIRVETHTPWYAKWAEWIALTAILIAAYRLYKFVKRNQFFIK